MTEEKLLQYTEDRTRTRRQLHDKGRTAFERSKGIKAYWGRPIPGCKFDMQNTSQFKFYVKMVTLPLPQ